MIWIAPIIGFIILIFFESYRNKTFVKSLVFLLVLSVVTGLVVAIDFSVKTTDEEVWSGRVTDWKHVEEYDEMVEDCSTDSDGKRTCTTRWVHHNAENYVYTTDNGWVQVKESPNGKRFTDRWPNNNLPLKEFWPYGMATASTHSYTNKVQASYSLYKHKDINLKEFPGLPKYPKKQRDKFFVDRIVGDVPNKDVALSALSEANAELNKFIPDPEKPGKQRSWKQVNLIFVNLGENKPQNWGYALQDYWEGGNKNDFIVSYSTDSEGKVLWTYAFSWSEVEILKLEVQDYMNNLGKIENFVPVVETVSGMVAEKFVRKEFADFSYLSIETSGVAEVIIVILNVILTVVFMFIIANDAQVSFTRRITSRKRNGRWR